MILGSLEELAVGFFVKLGDFFRGLVPRRRGQWPGWSGRLSPVRRERVCSLFDFFEFTPAQKAGIVFASLDSLQRKRVLELIGPQAMHQVVREEMVRRKVDGRLEESILKDFLGLELSGDGTSCLDSTQKCLHQLLEQQPEMVVLDLADMLLHDREAVSAENLEAQHFYLDLQPGHKVALVLWLTDALGCPQTTSGLSRESRRRLGEQMSVVSRLRLRTKLRVLREFLGLELNKCPHPNAVEEFGRLALALNKVKEKDPRAFGRKLLEQWPECS